LGHASPSITLGIYSNALPADNQAAAKLWHDAMAEVDFREPEKPEVITGYDLLG
jgi:hypothetical protein